MIIHPICSGTLNQFPTSLNNYARYAWTRIRCSWLSAAIIFIPNVFMAGFLIRRPVPTATKKLSKRMFEGGAKNVGRSSCQLSWTSPSRDHPQNAKDKSYIPPPSKPNSATAVKMKLWANKHSNPSKNTQFPQTTTWPTTTSSEQRRRYTIPLFLWFKKTIIYLYIYINWDKTKYKNVGWIRWSY